MPERREHENDPWGSTPELIQAVFAYSAAQRQQGPACSASTCCHCGCAPNEGRSFSLHARRVRRFFVVDGSLVHTIRVSLPRWKCPDCRRTFTEYPCFAVQYRRYMLPQVSKRLAWKYTSDPGTDYRASVKHSGQDIYHGGEAVLQDGVLDVPDESALSEHALAHTSLFHWITYLATHPPEHKKPRRVPISNRRRRNTNPIRDDYCSWLHRSSFPRCPRRAGKMTRLAIAYTAGHVLIASGTFFTKKRDFHRPCNMLIGIGGYDE